VSRFTPGAREVMYMARIGARIMRHGRPIMLRLVCSAAWPLRRTDLLRANAAAARRVSTHGGSQ
jgi:hypothetical protein